jgi:thioredoxin reductase
MRDVVVVGAGVAGLTAAAYLGRFRRPALIIDGGTSRAQWIPVSHNIPGFPQGVGREQLLSRVRAQAAQYGAEVLKGWVGSIAQEESGFAVQVDGRTIRTRFIVLATGVEDHLPPLLAQLKRSSAAYCASAPSVLASRQSTSALRDRRRRARGTRGRISADLLKQGQLSTRSRKRGSFAICATSLRDSNDAVTYATAQ